jgi:hypothetical protein
MATFSEAYPSNYLAAADIISAGPDGVELVIERVEMPGTAAFSDGKKVTKPILHFQKAKKGFVCNATNAKRLLLYYGADRDLDKWAGLKIRLITELVKNPIEGGKTPAIRVAKPGQKGLAFGGAE